MHEMFFTDKELEVLQLLLATEIAEQLLHALAGIEPKAETIILQTIAKKIAVEQGF